MKFSIITPVYNAEKYIEDCIKSVLHQDYENWEQIIINDGSTDSTGQIIDRLSHPKLRCIHNTKRLGPAYSHWVGLQSISTDSDVVVHLDGDDRFNLNKSLSIIQEAYDKTGCKASYGNYIASDGSGSVCRPPIGKIREQIRMGWPFSHVRTFSSRYAGLVTEDMLKDSNGNWLSSASDVAVITPVFEMIGLSRIVFINAPLLWYNRDTSLNEDKVNVQDQVRCAFEVYNKPEQPVVL